MSAWSWSSSETTGKIIPAFVAALQAMESVTKDRKADLGEKGAKYKYADLTSVMEVAKPSLAVAGLAVTQAAADDGVHTVVLHSSGEWISFPPLTVKTGQNTPQAQGSAITYAKRYQLLSVLGIATEDDDGRAAAAPAPKPVKTAARREAEAVYGRLLGLAIDGRDAFKKHAAGRKSSADALEADADWREEASNWLDAWAHDHPAEQEALPV